jgi:hypothetical protein
MKYLYFYHNIPGIGYKIYRFELYGRVWTALITTDVFEIPSLGTNEVKFFNNKENAIRSFRKKHKDKISPYSLNLYNLLIKKYT